MLRVHSIESFGTHDGPGIRMVLFLQGCALRCHYCHNPDTQACDGGEAMSVVQVIDRLERQRPYFRNGGGLTVSGGEPTLQADALIELFTEAKARGFHLALDTSGALWSPAINRLYDLTDLVILDVKHIDDEKHRRLTGMGNRDVLRNAEYRERSGKPMWLRHVIVPGWTDATEDLVAWACHFADYRTVERVELIPYHVLGVHKYAALGRPYALINVKPPTPDQMAVATAIVARHLKHVPELIAA